MTHVTVDHAVERVQFAYPQIYYACHTRHERRRSTDQHLSMRDSEILVHLDRRVPLTLGALAAHMDLAASTLSEAISHLETHGYVLKTQARDRRRVALLLTPKGVDAVRAAAVTVAVGYVLPKGHKASRTVMYAATPDAVFATIADVHRYPEWRSDLKSVDVLPDDGKGLLFREHGGNGDVLFRFETMDKPRRLIARIADPSLPFGGTWTYELQPGGAGTALTITEDGEVYNPIFRVMQKLFFSPYKTIDVYQADLKRRLFSS